MIGVLAVVGLYLAEQYWLKPATRQAAAASTNPALMQPMPAVTLQARDGSPVSLREAYQGKVLVLNFWASWCLPCRVEIPFFNQVYNEFKEQGVEFIAISEDVEGWPAIEEFIKEIPIEYVLLLDPDGGVGEAFGGLAGLPTTIYVDGRGRITKKHIGITDIDDLRSNIKRALGSGPAEAFASKESAVPKKAQ